MTTIFFLLVFGSAALSFMIAWQVRYLSRPFLFSTCITVFLNHLRPSLSRKIVICPVAYSK
jgi:hypothetical protein